MATPAEKLRNISTANDALPLKPLVLPMFPKSMLARFPELEAFRREENAALAEWIKSANVVLAS